MRKTARLASLLCTLILVSCSSAQVVEPEPPSGPTIHEAETWTAINAQGEEVSALERLYLFAGDGRAEPRVEVTALFTHSTGACLVGMTYDPAEWGELTEVEIGFDDAGMEVVPIVTTTPQPAGARTLQRAEFSCDLARRAAAAKRLTIALRGSQASGVRIVEERQCSWFGRFIERMEKR